MQPLPSALIIVVKKPFLFSIDRLLDVFLSPLFTFVKWSSWNNWQVFSESVLYAWVIWMLNVHSEEITSLSVLRETVGGWGSRVINFLVNKQCHVYMAYLTIWSIKNFAFRKYRTLGNCCRLYGLSAIINFIKELPQNTTVIQSEHTERYSKSSNDSAI